MYNLIDTITIITRISEGSRSEVYLASDARGELVIYKKIPGEDKTELYRRVNLYRNTWDKMIVLYYS